MVLPPAPSWLLRGPCDIRDVSGTAEELAWVNATISLKDPRLAAEATVAKAVIAYHDSTSSASASEAKKKTFKLLEKLTDVHPNAAYVLGMACVTGSIGQKQDVPRGRVYLQRGWDKHENVGCASVLLSTATTAEEKSVNSDRVVRFALQPDCLERARATGSLSAMTDVLWFAAEALKTDSSLLIAGARTQGEAADREATGFMRLYEMAADLGDSHAMMEVADRCFGRFESSSGFTVPLRPSEKGEKLCRAIVDDEKAPINLKSRALGLLGSAAKLRGEIALARSEFDKALRVCEEGAAKWLAGIDKTAVLELTRMCFEAEGGPQDVERATAALEHGVRLDFGPSLELAAQSAEREGDRVKASGLWARAAALQMPRAMAISYGISLDEAEARIALTDPIAAMLRRAGAKTSAISGKGISGGAPGSFDAPFSQNTVVRPFEPRCAACNRLGRLSIVEIDCSTLSDSALRARLTELRVPMASLLEKADLVNLLREAEAAALASMPALSACANCRTALYCNKACQQAHWPTHKKGCVRK